MTQEILQNKINFKNLWLGNLKFDLTFFHLSGVLSLFLLFFYLWKGNEVIFPIYNFYLIFFGIPHNYLTWATLLPGLLHERDLLL